MQVDDAEVEQNQLERNYNEIIELIEKKKKEEEAKV